MTKNGAGEEIRTLDPNLGKVRAGTLARISRLDPTLTDVDKCGIYGIIEHSRR